MEAEVKLIGKTSWTAVQRPIVRLNMIVKNEAACIKAVIRSVKNQVNSVVILDTGSTDTTCQDILDVCDELQLECSLYQTPFVNFSVSRNKALELAEKDADWLLVLSGDEYLNGSVKLPDPKDLAYPSACAWVNIKYGPKITFKLPKYITADGSWRYKCVTHEYLSCSSPNYVTLDYSSFLSVSHNKRPEDAAGEERRFARDIVLLNEEWTKREANPDKDWDFEKTRTAYYLAQSYDCHGGPGDKEKAVEWYKTRISLGGWQEEVYESQLRIGTILDVPGISYTDWKENCLPWYLSAYSTSAYNTEHRIEPINRIVSSLNKFKRYAEAYPYALTALSAEQPKVSRLFVDPNAYNYDRHLNFAISAYYMTPREFMVGHEQIRLLNILTKGEDPRVKSILESYDIKAKLNSPNT